MKLPAPPLPDALRPAPKRPGTEKPKTPLAQVKEAKVLAKYDDLGKGMIKTDFFLEMLYNELTQKPQGKFVAH